MTWLYLIALVAISAPLWQVRGGGSMLFASDQLAQFGPGQCLERCRQLWFLRGHPIQACLLIAWFCSPLALVLIHDFGRRWMRALCVLWVAFTLVLVFGAEYRIFYLQRMDEPFLGFAPAFWLSVSVLGLFNKFIGLALLGTGCRVDA